MKIPKMTPGQLAKARRLIRNECQKYDKDHNECLILDEGGGCACVQYISFSLLCKYSELLKTKSELIKKCLSSLKHQRHCF